MICKCWKYFILLRPISHKVAILVFIYKNIKKNESKVWVAVESAQSDDEKNVSDAWLASQIDVSRQTINYWINGQRDISVSRLHEVADALNVRVRDLFDE